MQLGRDVLSVFGQSTNLGLTLNTTGDRLRIGQLDASARGTAGFLVGDEILGVNRSWVRSPQELHGILNSALQVDGRAWVYVNRAGTRQWVNLDLTGRPQGMLGVHVLDNGGIVTVSNVFPGSFARQAGLLPGDEVISVNGIKISSNADLVEQIRTAAAGNGELTLDIRRNGTEQTMDVMLTRFGSLAAAVNNASPQGGTFSVTQLDRLQTRANSLCTLLGNLSPDNGSLTPDQIREAQAAASELARVLQALNSTK